MKESLKNIIVNIEKMEDKYPSVPDYVIKFDIHLNGNLSVLVKWENNSTSSVDYEGFKLRYPQKLLEFYESRIIFPFENSGTRKYRELHKPRED